MKRFILIWVMGGMVCLSVLLLLLVQPIHAQEEEVLQLRRKISELEGKIEQLEGLLDECMATKKKGRADEFGWQNKMNWRKLETGMSEAQVRSMLGKPTKVIKGVRTLWYYPNIYGGFVSFDKNGKLAGWNEP